MGLREVPFLLSLLCRTFQLTSLVHFCFLKVLFAILALVCVESKKKKNEIALLKYTFFLVDIVLSVRFSASTLLLFSLDFVPFREVIFLPCQTVIQFLRN